MIRTFWRSHYLTVLLAVMDAVALTVLWLMAYLIRRELNTHFENPINPIHDYYKALPYALLIWLVVYWHYEQYDHRKRISTLNELSRILLASLALFLATSAFAFFFKHYDPGRSVVLMFSVFGGTYLYASRSILRSVKHASMTRGRGMTRVLIVGTGPAAREVLDRIQENPEVGFLILGFVAGEENASDEAIDNVPVVGKVSELKALLKKYRVDEVFLTESAMPKDEMLNLIASCEGSGADFKLVTDLLGVMTGAVRIDEIGNLPVVLLKDGHLPAWQSALKRCFDLAVAIPFGLVLLPYCLWVARRIRQDSPGPALFKHQRMGKDGNLFSMYKFRTMWVGTDPNTTAPSAAGDDRVTPYGQLLRKRSIDEFPQLLNVIKGNMSMVGPRPEMPFIVEHYEPWQKRRLDVKPGITGLWQIMGRKNLPLHENLEYDFYYIRNQSLFLDVLILLKTIPAVIFGHGAF